MIKVKSIKPGDMFINEQDIVLTIVRPMITTISFVVEVHNQKHKETLYVYDIKKIF